ncbi:MAG TPA: hypothetical protein DD452_01720 [Nitrospina sp.]|jgi:hypothetical protein|nr:hypothetical protein [Nitrospinaceae bacterium]HBP10633.1 hypothetical protein [Nitrospina sp.]HCK69027.1 hypothetical protein [Nitrospina sp.]|tara:strand:+ start:3277 stop:3528 length:252 start_codon:yes stop_codon:yes gene_type:complete
MNEKTIHGEHWGSIVITGCVRGFILFSLILLMVVGTVTRVQLQSTAYNNGLSRVLTKNARVYVRIGSTPVPRPVLKFVSMMAT